MKIDKEIAMGDPMLRLMELDSRHTELLERLSELDKQVHDVLEDWTKAKEAVVAELAVEKSESPQSTESAAPG